MAQFVKYISYHKRLIIIGFGSIGKAVIPLIMRHINLKTNQITVITKDASGEKIANEYGINFIIETVTRENFQGLLAPKLSSGDFLLNLAVDVSSIELIKWCQEKNVLYLDTCIEPWAGGYIDTTAAIDLRSNYALRESAVQLKNFDRPKSTALITHGANPGLVSHFVKQAILNLAKENHIHLELPKNQRAWAEIANKLSIKAIHIAERDTQVANQPKYPGEFVNTWSVDGFIGEGLQPAELGWGSHEKHFPSDAKKHLYGCQSAIYLERPGGATKVRTWTPLSRTFHGFLITHGESISIANYLTLWEGNTVRYRPTVHYAYHPCPDAVLSMHELAGREWIQQINKRLIFDEIIDGVDELGVLLMGNEKGAYWYGSQLTIHEARRLAPHNNATSLQVAISVLAGMIWTIMHPFEGVVEPEEIPFSYILKLALPYLGRVAGYFTDWTPLKDRSLLFPEQVDLSDPWQFINMRVV